MDEREFEQATEEYKNIINQTIIAKGAFLSVYTYNLSCNYAIHNELDSAYKYLSIAQKLSPDASFIYDYDLVNLRSHPKWDSLILKYKFSFEMKSMQFLFPEIAYKLSLMKSADQAFRPYYSKKRYALELNNMIISQQNLDSQNLVTLLSISKATCVTIFSNTRLTPISIWGSD
jgi:hypothetical protein